MGLSRDVKKNILGRFPTTLYGSRCIYVHTYTVCVGDRGVLLQCDGLPDACLLCASGRAAGPEEIDPPNSRAVTGLWSISGLRGEVHTRRGGRLARDTISRALGTKGVPS